MATRAHQEELDYGTWRVAASPFEVEYSLQVLEELRAFAEEGYKKIPHGGVEVGALLLGSVDGNVVRISEWRPILCEHQRGPGFVLSEKDLQGLASLLETTAADPALAELKPVGWFHTHTRSALFLSPDDISIQNRFFPEPSQLAMVMTLAKDQPARAGFFFREADGGIDGASSPLTFLVQPNPVMRLRPPRKTAAPASPAAAPPAPATPSGPPPRRTGPSRARPLGFSPTAEYPPPAAAGASPAAAEPTPVAPPASYPVTPPDLLPEPAGVPFRWRVLAVAVAVLAAGATAMLTRPLWMATSSDALALRVEEAQSELIIKWDHNAAPVRRAQRGVLSIADGAARKELELSGEETRRGGVTYARTAEDVEVRLTVFDESGAARQESTRYLGPPVGDSGAAVAAPVDTPEQLRAERDRLRRALLEQSARATRLRRTLRELEGKLNR